MSKKTISIPLIRRKNSPFKDFCFNKLVCNRIDVKFTQKNNRRAKLYQNMKENCDFSKFLYYINLIIYFSFCNNFCSQ